jgi:hypothetical protein
MSQQIKKKNIITKHDKTVCGRKNTKFLETNCCSKVNLGDLSYYDIKLSNRVCNSFKHLTDNL